MERRLRLEGEDSKTEVFSADIAVQASAPIVLQKRGGNDVR
tara:strand:+ start:14982 stop:15104 length:123 start_codon:yes stop_codon:yes gene_type:complete